MLTADKTSGGCAHEAAVPLSVGAVQVEPHSFTLDEIRKSFNF